MSRDQEGTVVCDGCGLCGEYPPDELEESGWECALEPDGCPDLCPGCADKAALAQFGVVPIKWVPLEEAKKLWPPKPFVVSVTCVRRRPWAAPLWVEAMAAQTRRPDAVLVVVDEPGDRATWSEWAHALDLLGGGNWFRWPPTAFIVGYPHPSAPGWSRGTRKSGWREPEPGASGRYSDDQHAHLARLRNWTVERALELWPRATHLWCCDSDVAPDPDVLELLLAADKEVVAAVVRNGGRAWNFMLDWDFGEPIRTRNGLEHQIATRDDDAPMSIRWLRVGARTHVKPPWPVTMTGACALCRREVFDRGLRWAAHPRGEDIAFAIQARELEISLWVEPRARTRHYMAGPDKEPLR